MTAHVVTLLSESIEHFKCHKVEAESVGDRTTGGGFFELARICQCINYSESIALQGCIHAARIRYIGIRR